MQGNPVAAFSRLVLTIRIFSVRRAVVYTPYTPAILQRLSASLCSVSQAALPVMLSFRFSRLLRTSGHGPAAENNTLSIGAFSNYYPTFEQELKPLQGLSLLTRQETRYRVFKTSLHSVVAYQFSRRPWQRFFIDFLAYDILQIGQDLRSVLFYTCS